MQYIFIFICTFALLNCKTEFSQDSLTIDVNMGYISRYIGSSEPKFGLSIYIDVNDFFDASDIEDETKFSLSITGNNTNTYPLNCRLWKNEEKYIAVFCDFQGDFKATEIFPINDAVNITYNSTKNVTINFNIESLELRKIEGKLPFLYANNQTKDVKVTDTKINLEFKINSYNDEKLFIYHHKNYTSAPIENCKKENKILKCEVSKEKLDIIAKKNNEFEVVFLNEHLGFEDFRFVKNIKINYPDIKKEDIHFNFVKILNPDVETNYFVNIETNIINLPILKTTFITRSYYSLLFHKT